MDTLHRWNFVLGTLHLVQGLFMYVLPWLEYGNTATFNLPVTSLFTNWDDGYPVQVKGLITHINLVRWCACFALLSAAAHYTIILNFDEYTNQLARGMNRFRWYEYSLSSSLIIMLLFMVWGNFDFVQLSGVFLINALMCYFGDLFEIINEGKSVAEIDWTAFVYGSLAGAVTWILIWTQVFTSPYLRFYPWYAFAYLIGYQLFFFTFPINMYF